MSWKPTTDAENYGKMFRNLALNRKSARRRHHTMTCLSVARGSIRGSVEIHQVVSTGAWSPTDLGLDYFQKLRTHSLVNTAHTDWPAVAHQDPCCSDNGTIPSHVAALCSTPAVSRTK